MQMSGYYDAHNDFLGNVKSDGLKSLLQKGMYLDEICVSLKQLANANEKCAGCKYFRYCAGGCRALALALTGDKLGSDLAKCVFFKKGYYEKITKLLDGWENIAPIGSE